jgi:hypothetical protein
VGEEDGVSMKGLWRTAVQATPWLFAIALPLALSVVVSGPVMAQEPEEHDPAEGHAVESGESAGEHFHKNHVAIFIGSTEAEEEHGEQDDPDFTLGLDYGRRFSKLFGIGVMLEFVVEGKREYVVGVPFYIHVGRYAKFQLAPAFHHLSHTGENEAMLRTGFMWDFSVGKMTVSPALFYDIVDGQNFIVLGAAIGKGF